MKGKQNQKACGVILAGGQSSRMGQPKEILNWNGKPLILHMAESICRAGLPCVIVSNDPKRLPEAVRLHPQVDVWPDAGPSHGPISGIVTAMRWRTAAYYLVLSCDLPFLDSDQVQGMLRYALTMEADAILAVTGQRMHPLLGVYHRRTKPVWERALTQGDYRVMNAVAHMNWLPVPEDCLDPWATFNMNTPEDYQRALREWERRKREMR